MSRDAHGVRAQTFSAHGLGASGGSHRAPAKLRADPIRDPTPGTSIQNVGSWPVVTDSEVSDVASRGAVREGVARAVSQARLVPRSTPRPYAPRMFEHVTPSRSATGHGPRRRPTSTVEGRGLPSPC